MSRAVRPGRGEARLERAMVRAVNDDRPVLVELAPAPVRTRTWLPIHARHQIDANLVPEPVRWHGPLTTVAEHGCIVELGKRPAATLGNRDDRAPQKGVVPYGHGLPRSSPSSGPGIGRRKDQRGRSRASQAPRPIRRSGQDPPPTCPSDQGRSGWCRPCPWCRTRRAARCWRFRPPGPGYRRQ